MTNWWVQPEQRGPPLLDLHAQCAANRVAAQGLRVKHLDQLVEPRELEHESASLMLPTQHCIGSLIEYFIDRPLGHPALARDAPLMI